MKNLKNIFTVSALALALTACGSDSDHQLNVEGGVSISGETTSGQTLTAQVRDVNGVDESTVSYQWLSAGVAIPGATSSSYVLADSDIDSTITVTANYTDNDSFDESVVSAATEVIKPIILNVEGVVEITGTVESGQELTAVITDDNGLSLQGVSYAWLAGTDSIGTDAPTVTLTNDEVGKTVTVTVTYVDNDGFAEDVTSEATTSVAPLPPTDAEFSGALSATVTSSEAEPVTGTAIVTDLNEGESSFEELSDITTTYGMFSITSSGAWNYTLDTSNATVAGLTSTDDDLVDTIMLSSFDGTVTPLLITITGAELVADNVVKMTDSNIDTSTGDIGKYFGQINPIVAGTPLQNGKMTFSFKVEKSATNFDDNPSFAGLQSSRVTLSGDGNARSSLLELYFDVLGTSNDSTEGVIGLRNDNKTLLLDQTFTVGDWVDVAITWTGDGTVTPTLNISIDGEVVTTSDASLTITDGSFTSLSQFSDNVLGGMYGASLKLSAGANPVVGAAFYVDDVNIYSDVAGTVSVFSEDFEGYAEGTYIDGDDVTYTTNSNEALIVTELVQP
ncbi:VCBS domain-containing protein [Alteromonas sp. M12]|uniref:VCBS domain-containing protein n=1 Tax=Alteromonas sp. M12 TaxID=3135644 RepID=UPI00319D995E